MEKLEQAQIETPEQAHIESRTEKLEQAQISVRGMFDREMTTEGVVRKIDENKY